MKALFFRFYSLQLLGFYFLYFSCTVVIMKIFNPIAELVISIRIVTKEAKSNTEMNPLTVEFKISKCSM